MKTRMIHIMRSLQLIGLCALLGLTGCSLNRGAPPAQQYVLGQSAMPSTAPAGAGLTGLTIGIRRLDLATYLTSPGVLVRRGGQEITSSPFHLWAEPLDAGISRAFAGYLRGAAQLGAVDVAPWPVRTDHDYLLQLDVLRFEGVAPQDSAATVGEVHIITNWAILSPEDEEVLERGTAEHRSAGWTVGDYSGLVGMFNQGLQALAVEIAAALERVAAAPRELTSAP